MDKIKYEWDGRTATCTLVYKNIKFIGNAICAEEDLDMCSEKVGYFIAERRAEIELLSYERIATYAQYEALRDLYNTILNAHMYDKNEPSIRIIRSKMYNTLNLSNEIKNELNECKLSLRKYIDSKDEFYKKLREKRSKTPE